MTVTAHRQANVGQVLDAARALAPTISARAAAVEDARDLPPDLLADLVEAGCFRVLLPHSHGGFGADVASAMQVVETLARADGAVGWTVMIGGAAWIDLVHLPRPTFDALFADGPDVKIAGVFSPSGAAVAADGGYRVSGRWGFASGCRHADWLYGNCMEEVDGEHVIRTVLFAPGDVEIEDTWHALGLRGTGSHHFRVDNAIVPAARTCAPFAGRPAVDVPVVRVPPPALFALHVAAAAIGIAEGALDDIAVQAASKVPLLASAPLAASATYQRDLAVAVTDVAASRALLHEVAGEVWQCALTASPLSDAQRARVRAAAASAVTRAVAAVATAYRAGGGSAVYVDNPLQRRLRDIQTLAQHFLVRPDTLVTAGALLAGQAADVPVF